jgi:hypothetical protein
MSSYSKTKKDPASQADEAGKRYLEVIRGSGAKGDGGIAVKRTRPNSGCGRDVYCHQGTRHAAKA